MKKDEMNDVLVILRDFIVHLYRIAELSIPNEFHPETEAYRAYNTIVGKAKVKLANDLMLCETDPVALEDLTKRLITIQPEDTITTGMGSVEPLDDSAVPEQTEPCGDGC